MIASNFAARTAVRPSTQRASVRASALPAQPVATPVTPPAIERFQTRQAHTAGKYAVLNAPTLTADDVAAQVSARKEQKGVGSGIFINVRNSARIGNGNNERYTAPQFDSGATPGVANLTGR